MCVYVCDVCVSMCVVLTCKSEDFHNVWKSVFFHHVDLGDHTEVSRLGDRHLHLPSFLFSSEVPFVLIIRRYRDFFFFTF